MRKEIDSFPMVVFSYHPCYAAFFCDLAEQAEVRTASYLLALTPVKTDASPLINVLEFRTEELGYLAGATLAHSTVAGHLATICFDEEIGERFVAGFRQGMQEPRSGATLSALYVSRSDLLGKSESVKFLAKLLTDAGSRYQDGMGIDAVAFLTGLLAEPFIKTLPRSDVIVTAGPLSMDDTEPRVVLTSTYIDFAMLPQYIVENAEDLGLLRPQRGSRGVEPRGPEIAASIGEAQTSWGTRYIPVGLADGLLNYTGFASYERFRSLPEEFAGDIAYYYRAICAGEIEVSPEMRN